MRRISRFLRFRRPLAAFLALVLVVVLGGSAAVLSWLSVSYAADAERTRALSSTTRLILINMLDAETGERGYLITGDRQFLEPYFSARSGLQDKLRMFHEVGDPSSREIRDVGDDIDRLARDKMDQLAAMIVMRTQKPAQVVAEVRQHVGEGKNIMDQLRRRLDQVQLWADANFKRSRDRASECAQMALVALAALVVVLSIGFIGALLERPGS